MQVTPLSIPDVLLIRPARNEDSRGYLSEVFSQSALAEHGASFAPVQENVAFSVEANVVRGLHAQAPPWAQAKLVRVGRGRVFDVAVDARRGSPTFGQVTGAELSAEAGTQMFVPKGFLHGYATLEPGCEVVYLLDAPYAPQAQIRVAWNDADLGANWGVPPDKAILSPSDRTGVSWAAFDSPFIFG